MAIAGDRKPMNELHFRLIEEIKREPKLDVELHDGYGSDYLDLIGDLQANDYPIWRESAFWKDRNVIIYFYEGDERILAPCVVCTIRRRSIGPFCSTECESRYVNDAMGRLSRRRIPEKEKPNAHEEEESERTKKRKQLTGGMQLRNVIPAATIIHISNKAKSNGKLTKADWNNLSFIGNKLYVGHTLTTSEKTILESTLQRAIQAGVAGDECPNAPCKRCSQLKEILDAYGY